CAELELADCPGVPSSHFVWALRDATAAAGHFDSAIEADSYFQRLAEEIDRACAAGRLACLAPRTTLAPPFRWDYVAASIAPALAYYRLLVTFGDQPIELQRSPGEPEEVARFVQITGGESLPARRLHAAGWAYSTEGIPQLAVDSD